MVVGQHQAAEARVHGTQLPDLGPVSELVVGHVQQVQRGAGGWGFCHRAVTVQTQEELRQSGRQQGWS